MIALGPGISYTDLCFQGTPRIIATAVLHGPGGAALVDPGPSSTLPALRSALSAAGIALQDLTAILLTHIHLDHAGATGTLVREHPRLQVYVHAKGAPHMSHPEKLLASAARLYGDAMDRLWGEFLPVPEHSLQILYGGERIGAGGRQIDVAYTPGHASHHVSYLVPDAGLAFVGDTAGVKILPDGDVLPPTPPPDIDLEAWGDSLAQIERWRPDTVFLTHFGPAAPVVPHLAALRENLALAARLARESMAASGADQEREAWFVEANRHLLRRHMNEDSARTYELAARFDLSWRGLARYLAKRAG
jgi:glyoxylase-like metal-dependent hydrolase (beta-lactamase superfamily II)